MNNKMYVKLNLLMLAISLAAFLLIGYHPYLQNDDMSTLLQLRGPIRKMWHFLVTEDIHLPVYFFLIRGWFCIFGDSVFSARCFSYLGVLCCAFGGGIMLRRLYGEKAALWFTLLFLCSPGTFYMAYIIRMYSFACFFCLAAFLSAQAAFQKEERKDFILYVLFSFLASWTHYYAAFFCALTALSFLEQSRKKGKAVFEKFFICNTILFLLVCPEVIFFSHQNVITWITMKHVGTAWADLFQMEKIGNFYKAIPTFVQIFLWFAGIQFLLNDEKSERKNMAKTALVTGLGVFGIGIIISVLYRPAYVGRYSLIFWGALFVFFTMGIYENRINKIILSVLLPFSFFYTTFYIHHFTQVSVQKEFYQMVKGNVSKDDVIVTLNWQIVYWLYYHFPEYDIRIFKGTEQNIFWERQKLIDLEGIQKLLKSKKVFVMSDVETEKNIVFNLYSEYDPYLGLFLELNQILPNNDQKHLPDKNTEAGEEDDVEEGEEETGTEAEENPD